MLEAAWRRRRRFILGRAVWRWRRGAAVDAMLEERREHARVLALVRAEQVASRRRMAELQAQSLKVIQAISLQSTVHSEGSDSEGKGKGGESLSMVVLDAGKAHDRDIQEQLLVLHEENANLMSRLKRHTLDASSMMASKAALERLLDERAREIDELQQMRGGLRRSQLGEEEAGGEEDAFGRGADDEEGDDDQQLRDPIKAKQREGGKRRSGGVGRGGRRRRRSSFMFPTASSISRTADKERERDETMQQQHPYQQQRGYRRTGIGQGGDGEDTFEWEGGDVPNDGTEGQQQQQEGQQPGGSAATAQRHGGVTAARHGKIVAVLRIADLLRERNLRCDALFQTMDTDNDGSVSRSELWAALQGMGVDVKAPDIDALFVFLDRDRNDAIGVAEFERGLRLAVLEARRNAGGREGGDDAVGNASAAQSGARSPGSPGNVGAEGAFVPSPWESTTSPGSGGHGAGQAGRAGAGTERTDDRERAAFGESPNQINQTNQINQMGGGGAGSMMDNGMMDNRLTIASVVQRHQRDFMRICKFYSRYAGRMDRKGYMMSMQVRHGWCVWEARGGI